MKNPITFDPNIEIWSETVQNASILCKESAGRTFKYEFLSITPSNFSPPENSLKSGENAIFQDENIGGGSYYDDSNMLRDF